MAEKWFDAASQQVTLLAGRLNELLSTGLDRLHSELGVDFGVKPEIPPWVILLAACIGLLLMVALWASACRGLFKKSPIIEVDEAILSTAQAPVKAVRAEEQKKKKRKPTEKKSQPNGRAVAELQEEVRVTEEDNQPAVPHLCPQVKTENTSEIKKTKKKEKQPLKKAKKATSGVKEPEEVLGSWETKVSNKEKREQRRKDKTTGDWSGSPEGIDLLPCTLPSEQPKASPKVAAPVSGSEKKEKKKKGDSFKTKTEKADAAFAIGTAYAVSSDVTPAEGLVVAGEWTHLAPEAPVLTTVPNEEHWTSPETTIPSGPDSNPDTTVWGQETEGGWTVIDAGITGLKTTDVHLVSFSGLGVDVEPQPEIQWLSHPHQPGDEWSGLNGRSSAEVDGGSDWSAPAEVWGNFEEPPTVETSALTVEEPQSVMISEKEEAAIDVTGKSKKKKKKKKKAEDAAVTGQESEEPIRELVTQVKVKKQSIQEPAAVEARVEKPVVVLKNTIPITQVPPQPADKETTKQNSLPVPTQKTSEESQPSKPVTKKKRARRET